MFAARSENYLCMVVNLHVMHTVSNVSPFKHDTLLASKCVVIYIPCKKVQDSCFSMENFALSYLRALPRIPATMLNQ